MTLPLSGTNPYAPPPVPEPIDPYILANMALLTPERVTAGYNRVFELIPPSFLKPEARANQEIIGPMGMALAYIEQHWEEQERELFIDSATDLGLARFGAWLGLPEPVGLTPDQFRQMLGIWLYGPRVTLTAIAQGFAIATSAPTEVFPVGKTIFCLDSPGSRTFNYPGYPLTNVFQPRIPYPFDPRVTDGWEGKKFLGEEHCWAIVEVTTEGKCPHFYKLADHLGGGGTRLRPRWRYHDTMATHSRLIGNGSAVNATSHANTHPENLYPFFPQTGDMPAWDSNVQTWGHSVTQAKATMYRRCQLLGPKPLANQGWPIVADTGFASFPVFDGTDGPFVCDSFAWRD
jgi:hypothetical protein